MATEVPDRAHVVVIGGGVIGTSVAYHLTKLGLTDVVLLEQGQLSCGTTWHAAGLVGQLRASESATRLVQYSTQLYAGLEDEIGLSTGYKRCGGVTVARTEDRMIQLRRTAASAAAFDLECELLTPEQALERYPVMRVDDLVGAIWLPGDGKANPTDLTFALAKGARQRGARVFERTRVLDVLTDDGRVTGVRTDAGDIEAEIVVNCAGQWAKAVGAMAGVNVPLHSAEHFYVVTEPIEGVHPDLPVLRDPDGYTYFKEEVGGLVVGGFEPEAKPWVSPDEIPYPFEFQLLDEDWDHFSILMDNAVLRIPALEETGIRKFYNGPESFTPDNQFILGEAPEVGTSSSAPASTPSASPPRAGRGGRWRSGSSTASPPGPHQRRHPPVRALQRQQPVAARPRRRGARAALRDPVAQPGDATARPFRRSPVYHLLEAANANFGSRMGWERANFFAPAGGEPVIEYSWGKQNWLPWTAAEQANTRNNVTVFDQTSFSKYLLVGPDAEAVLQWLCTADVRCRVGRTVYTGMLNDRGTYESDVTVTRAPTSTSSSAAPRPPSATRTTSAGICPHGARATLVDVTSAYAVFGVMGPKSRELLSRLTAADLADEAFPFGTSQEITLGYSTVRATRITYVGELGWELYVPAEFAVGVYEDLMAAGEELGVGNGGYYAIDSMRLEKGYRAFGRELTPDYNPVEAGLLFACKLKTDIAFLGREAVEKAKAEGPRRKLVVHRRGAEAMLWGGELVLRDGAVAGQVISAAWGETLGACVGLAYVRAGDNSVVNADWVKVGSYEVNVGGQLSPDFGVAAADL